MSAMKQVHIKIAPDQDNKENQKTSRKGLKIIQQTAVTDKENLLAGRPKDIKLASDDKTKYKKYTNKAIQVGDAVITAEDLISQEPSADYWKKLAEKRGADLEESLRENSNLNEIIESLKEENKICKEMLEESRLLVEVLQEMVADDTEASTNDDEHCEGI